MSAYTVVVESERLVVQIISELDDERVLVSILAPHHWRGITMPVEVDRLEPRRAQVVGRVDDITKRRDVRRLRILEAELHQLYRNVAAAEPEAVTRYFDPIAQRRNEAENIRRRLNAE